MNRNQFCKGCKAKIQWGRHHRTGSWMIFDTAKAVTQEGELRWVLGEHTLLDRELKVPAARQAKVGELGVLDHHATCTDVDEWRNPKR